MTGYLLRMMRREEQRTFESECTVTRDTGDDGFVDEDGNWQPGGVATIHEGLPCRIRPSLEATREFEQAGQKLHLHLTDFRVAHDTDIEKGDVVTVTKSRDARLVDRHAVVRALTFDDWVVTRRVILEEPR